MKHERSKKNIVEDVLPPKRSIRNIELPLSRRKKTVSDIQVNTRLEEETEYPEKDKFSREVPMSKAQPSRLPRPGLDKIVVSDSAQPTSPSQKEVSSTASHQTYSSPVPAMHSYGGQNTPPAPSRQYAYEYEEPSRSSRKGLVFAVAIFILAGAFGVSFLFKGATISVTPRNASATVNQSFTAEKDATGAVLGFQVVTVSKEVTKSVPATGQKNVETKASGTIVIYNDTPSSQPLVATTRFETPEGLIFRLDKAVTVPGQRKSGSKTIPGSVEAVVTADVAGPSYNIGLKDFTVPGLKGSSKYENIYARSKTSMTGGFSGVQKTVSQSDLVSADGDLQATLKEGLTRDISTQIPADFVLYSDSLTFSFDNTSQVQSTSTLATLQKRGTATAIIFDKGALTRAITAVALPDEVNNPLVITNLAGLDFAYASGSQSLSSSQTISFTLSGKANFVRVFDADKLKNDLLGLSKMDAQAVIASSYPAIGEVWIETRPFWNKTIPTNPDKVSMVNTLDTSGK